LHNLQRLSIYIYQKSAWPNFIGQSDAIIQSLQMQEICKGKMELQGGGGLQRPGLNLIEIFRP
jgi:hypothetical protein